MSDITLRRLKADDPAMALIKQLRREVLLGKDTGERPLSAEDLDEATIHVAAFDGDNVVSAVRLERVPASKLNIYLVSRMATDPRYQGQGIGASVLRFAETTASKAGIHRFILEARPSAEEFYRKQGYKALVGQKPQKPGEIPMYKDTK